MRMRFLSFVVLMMVSVGLLGCSQRTLEGNSIKERDVLYASMIIFNNDTYYLSSELISKDNLGEQIGQVEKQVIPSPKNNGEANECPVGTKIFQIKGVDVRESVGVYFQNEYRKASTMEQGKSDKATRIYTDKRFNFSV